MQAVCAFVLTMHAAASTVFFHELSSIDLEPGDSRDASFGFSLAYQAGKTPRILIGAPRYDEMGRVFQCPLGSIRDAKQRVKCEPLGIDLDAMGVEYSREFSTNQHFYLGASIAATEKFFLTCAPLRTATLENKRFFGAYGICFIYNDEGQVKPWRGPGREKYLKELRKGEKITWQDQIYGGHGWATLVDEAHERVLVTKSFTICDMYLGNISAPYDSFQSLVNQMTLFKNEVFKYKNYGQAMTLGNYFDPIKENTLYAINTVYDTARGGFQLRDSKTLKEVYSYTDINVGSMFGSSLASADVTRDACAELLVGAPAHADDDFCWDRGALHIFTATSNEKMELKLTIRGGRDGARFATSLAAYDVNGDSYPEIIVGAPGESAVYVLCGYEIYKILTKTGDNKPIDLPYLSNTQKIEKASYKQFGFSSLPIIDLDDNGSGEFLVGAPGQSKVTLYRGIPSITVEVTSRVPNVLLTGDYNYVISSCVKVLRPEKPKKITTKLRVTNVLKGNDATFASGVTKDSYVIDFSEKGNRLSDGREEYCKELSINSSTVCMVTTKVSLDEDITKIKDFSNTWVMLSNQSTTEKSITLTCSCTNPEDCKPELSAQLDWRNRTYIVGSSRVETVNITVRNTGTRACAACAIVRVRGAAVAQLRCDRREVGDYLCYLPSPFKQNGNELIELKLWMDISNQNKNLEIEVKLKKTCEEPEETTKTLTVPYVFSEDLVSIQGSGFNYSLSDIELNNEEQETITEEQTFTLVTTESVTWENVLATITSEKKPYIQSLQVSVASKPVKNCEVSKDDAKIISANCLLTLRPNSMVVITVYTAIVKKEIKNHMKNWEITLPSKLKLQLSTDLTKHYTVTTVIMLQKQAIGQNKTLIIIIGVVVGLVLLALLSFILFKVGFFKRKKKEELQSLKKEFRRRSTIRDRTASQRSHTSRSTNCNDMEDLVIVEEYPFDEPSPAGPLDSSAPAPDTKKAI